MPKNGLAKARLAVPATTVDVIEWTGEGGSAGDYEVIRGNTLIMVGVNSLRGEF